MNRWIKTTCAAAALISLGAGAAYAQAKPEDLLKYRQGVMRAVAFQFGPLNAVAKGEAPWGPAMAQRAANLAALAVIAGDVFGPASQNLPNSDAKAEIWSKPDDFRKVMAAFQAEAAKLGELAKAGDADKVKDQLGKLGGTCKACHDDFRVKR